MLCSDYRIVNRTRTNAEMLAIYKDASKGHLDSDSVSVNQDGQCHGQHLASILYLWASTIPFSCIYHAMFLPCFHPTSTAFLPYFFHASTMLQPYLYHASTGVYLLGNQWCSPWSLVSDLTSSGFSSSPIGGPVPLFFQCRRGDQHMKGRIEKQMI